MRVLCLSPMGYFKGGAERSLFDVLSNPAASFLVVVPDDGPLAARARAEGHEVAVVPFGAVNTVHRPLRLRDCVRVVVDWYKSARGIARLTKAHNIDIVHTNGLKAHAIGVLARRLGAAPVILHIRDIAVTRTEVTVFRFLGKLADHVVLVSRPCWPEPVQPRNVSIVHNGVQIATETYEPRPIQSDTLVVGICGRIHPAKGHHLLPEWMAAAKAAGHKLRLVIRGEVEPGFDSYLDDLVALFAQHGVSDLVAFEGAKQGLTAIYGSLDLVVTPSQTPDPLPRSVMEAMSLGIPVAGYPAGGVPEMISHRKTGWLVADEADFLSCLADLNDKAAVDVITAAGRAHIRQEFSIGRLHDQLTDIYRAVGHFPETANAAS